ncbi:MAG: acylphosphatase [Pseudomonadales bacterium]|jgi:acylphosphatase|nr:acylphosphatase [Pseudomonadales bacterium]
MKTVNAVITGRVQGVAYRYWTAGEAVKRDLTGFVRNRVDGSVEAVFCGDDNRVDDMLAACKTGPTMAVVDSVTVLLFDQGPKFMDFVIEATL